MIFAVPTLPAYQEYKLSTPAILFMIGKVCCKLPFTGICLWNALRKQSSKNQSMMFLILAPVLYVADSIPIVILNNIMIRIIGAAEYASAMMISNFQNYFNIVPWHTAALVLICCAMSIELFIFKHKESEI